MQLKLLISIALIAVPVGVALARHTTIIGYQTRKPATIKIVVNQPPAKDGVIPIEIIQPSFVSSAPNRSDLSSYGISGK
jgi:hypothetical protein